MSGLNRPYELLREKIIFDYENELRQAAEKRNRRLNAAALAYGLDDKQEDAKRMIENHTKSMDTLKKIFEKPSNKNDGYGNMTERIKQIIASLPDKFSIRDIWPTIEKEFPGVKQSSVSTTLIRMANPKKNGPIKEVERKGRMAIYSKNLKG